TPLKLIEALAYGLPVIAKPRAVAALQLRDGVDCLVAGDGETFAQTLVDVLREGSAELGRNARRVAEQRYSIEALGALLQP
ncbi:MAG TPA: hypothetical protein VN845_08090, partial [Solirubrobacteraceae bacterium]|nr:hypothetical protein [Solirubrobacteraceae bacterium]